MSRKEMRRQKVEKRVFDIKKVFISYKDDDNRSKKIVDQLVKFFIAWENIESVPVSRAETTAPPKEVIAKELGEAAYLIQILNNKEGPSKWMVVEWEQAESLSVATETYKLQEGIRTPIALYTNKIDLNSQSYQFIKNAKASGNKRVINIDKQDPSPTLIGILVETGRLPRKHGGITVPDFCKKPQDPDEVNLKALIDFIDNFRYAQNRGLVSVYPDNKASLERLKPRLKNIEENETIRMVGFTLNRYVYPDNEKGIGNIFYSAIKKEGVKAQLLLLNPYCSAAKERMKIESNVDIDRDDSIEDAILYKHNRAVAKYYSNNGHVDIKYYKTPYVGMVLFDDIIFVELYHLGHDGESKKEKTICGRVPVLVIKKPSPFYNLFDSHFANLWENAKKEPKNSMEK